MRSAAIFSLVLVLLTACEGSSGVAEPPRRDPASASSSVEAAPPAGRSPEDPDGEKDQPTSDKRRSPERTYLVWTPGGLPPGALSAAADLAGVVKATEVTGGLIWMSAATSGKVPRAGYEIPIEVAFVDPPGLAHMFPSAPGLNFKGRDLIFSRTGFALRGVAKGAYFLTSDQGTLTGRCCMSDRSAMGYEAVAIGAPPPGWGSSYALLRAERKPRLHEIKAALGAGPWRIKSHSDTNFLRYADAVVPQMLLKERFGEFSARPSSDGTLDIDPGWVKEHIVKKDVPVLGTVECHGGLIPQMRAALGEAETLGLVGEVKPGEYAGCFNARFIGRDSSGRLSTHAWGAAFDIAAASNPLGAPPTLDPDVVKIFHEKGFNWGGEWLIPDGMHFEWSHPAS